MNDNKSFLGTEPIGKLFDEAGASYSSGSADQYAL